MKIRPKKPRRCKKTTNAPTSSGQNPRNRRETPTSKVNQTLTS